MAFGNEVVMMVKVGNDEVKTIDACPNPTAVQITDDTQLRPRIPARVVEKTCGVDQLPPLSETAIGYPTEIVGGDPRTGAFTVLTSVSPSAVQEPGPAQLTLQNRELECPAGFGICVAGPHVPPDSEATRL